MQLTIERPFDLLNSLKGKRVVVHCKAYKDYSLEGVLHAFDATINIVLEIKEGTNRSLRFIRGDNVVFIEASA